MGLHISSGQSLRMGHEAVANQQLLEHHDPDHLSRGQQRQDHGSVTHGQSLRQPHQYHDAVLRHCRFERGGPGTDLRPQECVLQQTTEINFVFWTYNIYTGQVKNKLDEPWAAMTTPSWVN